MCLGYWIGDCYQGLYSAPPEALFSLLSLSGLRELLKGLQARGTGLFTMFLAHRIVGRVS